MVGDEVKYLSRELKKNLNITLDASFAVSAPANCIYISNPPSGEPLNKQLLSLASQAEKDAGLVAKKERGLKAKCNPVAQLLSLATSAEEKRRSTKAFSALEDRCIGCGTCASICPTNVIEMKNDTPHWAENGCTECFACIHRCPTQAIQWGKISLKRNRYVNPILK